MKVKQLISWVAVIVLLVSMAGCSKGEKAEGTSPNPSTEAVTSNGSQVPDEELRIKIRCNTSVDTSLDTVVGQKIKEKFNIVFEYIPFAGDAIEQLSIWLATNDLPDVVEMQTDELTRKYIAAEKLISLEPYLKDMQNFTERYKETIPYWRVPGDGTMYIWQTRVPRVLDTDVAYECNDIAVRSDLVEKYGWETIVSTSDWVKFLETVTPGTVDVNGNQVAGMGGNFGDTWGLEGALPIMYEKGDTYTAISNTYYTFNSKIKQYEDYFKNPFIKEGFEFFNNLHKKNLLDPEAFTDTIERVVSKMKTGSLASSWYICFLYPEINKALIESGHPEMQYITMPVQTDSMVATGMKRQIRNETTRQNENWGITKNLKAPERYLQLLDYLASDEGQILLRSGVEGEQWEMVNGVRTAKQELLDCITDSELENSIFIPYYGTVYFNANSDDGLPHDLRLTVENYEKYRITDRQNEAYEKLGWGSETGWYLNGNSFFNETGITSSITVDPETELGKIAGKMLEFRSKSSFKLVTSKDFDETYNELVTEYDKLGGNAVIEEMNRLYEEQISKLDSYQYK